MQRTSRKQIERILESISYGEIGYQLVIHSFCGKEKYYYKYSINRYNRKPDYVDQYGRIVTWTKWEYEKTLIEFVTLKQAFAYASHMLSETLDGKEKK